MPAQRYLLLLLLLLCPIATAQNQLTAIITHDTHQITLTVEVARSVQEKRRGLSHRSHLPADAGMWFAPPLSPPICFWMKNTHIPLAAAFIDQHNTIVQVAIMHPHSLEQHCATHPTKSVLEVNATLANSLIKVGATVNFLSP